MKLLNSGKDLMFLTNEKQHPSLAKDPDYPDRRLGLFINNEFQCLHVECYQLTHNPTNS